MAVDPILTESYFKPITNTATGRVAFEVKAGDGTIKTVECGDTGLRDLSGMFVAGKVLTGRVAVKRVGSTITWYFNAVQIAANATHPWEVIAASAATAPFAPESNVYQAVMSNATDTGRILLDGLGSASIHYGEPSQTYTAAITFNTSRPWPTTLPGVANGQPVGV